MKHNDVLLACSNSSGDVSIGESKCHNPYYRDPEKAIPNF